MEIRINSTNAVALSDVQSLSATALSQASTQSDTGAVSGVTGIEAVDTAAMQAFQEKWLGVEAALGANGLTPAALQNVAPGSDAAAAALAKYQTALDANARSGQNAEAVATALVPVMQQLAAQRPELANAQFDFQSDDGAIQVTSSTLSNSDRQWIQNLLNGNGTLVQAVQHFHDDLVTGYSAWADADGTPLTSTQTQAASKQADGLVSFLDLFHRMGVASTPTAPTEDKNIYDLSGKKIDLSRNTGTANGFLGFMSDAQASRYGAVYDKTARGNAYGVGAAGDVFTQYKGAQYGNGSGTLAVPFFPPGATLGVHEIA